MLRFARKCNALLAHWHAVALRTSRLIRAAQMLLVVHWNSISLFWLFPLNRFGFAFLQGSCCGGANPDFQYLLRGPSAARAGDTSVFGVWSSGLEAVWPLSKSG